MGTSSVFGWLWEVHFESGGLTRGAGDACCAAVQARDGCDQRESKTAPAILRAGAGRIGPVERLEQMRQVRGIDAGPGVLDRQAETASPRNRVYLHRDAAAQRGK